MNNKFDKRWRMKKHTNNKKRLLETALYLKENKSEISKESKDRMYKQMARTELYTPRESKRKNPLDSMNHRIDALRYFMFGYYDRIDKTQKFIFSPLGNLFLKNIDDSEKNRKIFVSQLFGLQFPHIGSKPSQEYFKLYPFRLIFKLLMDARLDYKLYYYEIETIIVFKEKLNEEIYKQIVQEILLSREKTWEEKASILKDDQYEYVTIVYEWEYYTIKLMSQMGVIDNTEGEEYARLNHKSKPGSKNTTERIVKAGYIQVPNSIQHFVSKMLDSYSAYDAPIELSNPNEMSSSIVKDIYMFYPEILLKEIGENIKSLEKNILNIPSLIEEYSQNKNNETYDLFEDILTDAFNMFKNVNAEKISGSGRTDIECVYTKYDELYNNGVRKKKFAVDAKSTKNKLLQINAGRLKRHLELISGEYTVVVTPSYVPSVEYDIKGQNIVILKAGAFAEYLYNNIRSGIRDIDYKDFDEIIVKSLGTDISSKISDVTLSIFGGVDGL